MMFVHDDTARNHCSKCTDDARSDAEVECRNDAELGVLKNKIVQRLRFSFVVEFFSAFLSCILLVHSSSTFF